MTELVQMLVSICVFWLPQLPGGRPLIPTKSLLPISGSGGMERHSASLGTCRAIRCSKNSLSWKHELAISELALDSTRLSLDRSVVFQLLSYHCGCLTEL